jgi:hypothetical protein
MFVIVQRLHTRQKPRELLKSLFTLEKRMTDVFIPYSHADVPNKVFYSAIEQNGFGYQRTAVYR